MNDNPFGIRGRLRFRSRVRHLASLLRSVNPELVEREKLHFEMEFWIRQWDARLRSGSFWNDDIEDLLRPLGQWSEVAEIGAYDYHTIRELEARSHGIRILKEADIEDFRFFSNKIVVDIGPGAVCFLERSDARLGIAVEPLAREFKAHNLLLTSSNTIYLPIPAEKLALADASVDVVVSRNNLDHVTDPARVVKEIFRILKPEGIFILIVHLEPETSPTEPHAFSVDDIHALTRPFAAISERITCGGRTSAAETLAGVYRKPDFG